MAEPDHTNQPTDGLDHALDAALAKYAAVEPRAGLDGRILANLRSQPYAEGRPLWRWGLALALAVALIAAGLAWRSSKSRPVIVQQPSGKDRVKESVKVHYANTQPATVRKQAKLQAVVHQRATARIRDSVKLAAAQKREQFPSPQPLSEQEKLLASYVEQYPERAVLIARARAEQEQRDREEEMRDLNGTANGDSKQIQQ